MRLPAMSRRLPPQRASQVWPFGADQTPLEAMAAMLRWCIRRAGFERDMDFADQVGIQPSMLSAYLTGGRRPTLARMDEIIAALGIEDANTYNLLLCLTLRALLPSRMSQSQCLRNQLHEAMFHFEGEFRHRGRLEGIETPDWV